MKKVFYSLVLLLFLVGPVIGQNVIDDIVWEPEGWTKDESKTEMKNLADLLTLLADEASKYPDLKCIEMHFSSVKMLVEAYPPTTEMVNDLITVYSNYDAEGGMHKYIDGAKQLLIAYEYKPGTVSFVVYTLPENWDPRISYPLYVWGKEAGRLWAYPEGVHKKLEEQIRDGLLYRGPSSRFKDGYTVIPGSLGRGTFNADAEEDFLMGLDLFLEEFRTDKSKYYLGGFSQGAGATWNISTKEGMMDKYQFAALALHAPSVRDDRINSTFSSRISEVPIWLSAGENDSRYGGIANVINDLLNKEGYPPEVFYIEPGKGHTWTQTLQGDMCYFFQKHQRLMPGDAPQSPENIAELESGERQVKISWTDNSTNELHFVIKRKLKGEFEFSEIAKVAPDVEFYIDNTVVSGNQYSYKVYAYNASGISEPTDELIVNTPGETISNVALLGDINVSDESSEDNGKNLIDGHTLGTDMYRWNASDFPQWAEIDLKAEHDISIFKVYAYDNREYLYKIEVKPEGGEYTTVVDRTAFNKSAPAFIDEVDVKGRYVRFTVTGALVYAGTAINISELEIYGRMMGQVEVTGVSLDKSVLQLSVGEGVKLSATVSPEDASIKTVNWFSDNEEVAKIYQTGYVEAVSSGTANITVATESGNATAVCQVNVSSVTAVGNEDNHQIHIFPNPVSNGFFNLTLDLLDKPTVQIINIEGKIVKQFTPTNSQTVISVDELNNGVYFLQISSEGKIIAKKMISKI